MQKPRATTAKEGFVRTKQAETRERNDRKNIDVEIIIDEKQVEREIDRAMKKVISKLNK